MDKIARLKKQERSDLFRETADQIQFHPMNVEKDFWVCWLLSHLFSIEQFKNRLVFKGGTSLSKGYNLIHRFSEDIDLAVNYEKLGFVDQKSPLQPELSQAHSYR